MLVSHLQVMDPDFSYVAPPAIASPAPVVLQLKKSTTTTSPTAKANKKSAATSCTSSPSGTSRDKTLLDLTVPEANAGSSTGPPSSGTSVSSRSPLLPQQPSLSALPSQESSKSVVRDQLQTLLKVAGTFLMPTSTAPASSSPQGSDNLSSSSSHSVITDDEQLQRPVKRLKM